MLKRAHHLILAFVLAAILCGVSTRSFASDSASSELDWAAGDLNDELSNDIFSTGSRGKKRWEVGMDVARILPDKNSDLSMNVSNDVLGLAEVDEEFFERGLVGPGPGVSTVGGSSQAGYEVDLHVFRRLTPFLALGVEGGYAPDVSVDLRTRGIYDTDFFETDYTNHIFHLTPTVKVGGWLGMIKPYFLAGAGWFNIHERVSLTVVDVDDPGFQPVNAADRSNDYLGTNIGGGIDVKVPHSGSIGVSMIYRSIYKPGDALHYYIPSVRFAYLF